MASTRITEIVQRECGSSMTCLPCERVNLDYERFREFRESNENPAEEAFENPPLPTSRKKFPCKDGLPTAIRYFMDGSRRTYKVAEVILSDGRFLPIIGGQAGVAVIHRDVAGKLKVMREYSKTKLLIAFPDLAKPDQEVLQKKITEQCKTLGFPEFHIVSYSTSKESKDPVDLGTAKIISEMHHLELRTIEALIKDNRLTEHLLVKDGSLQYGDERDVIQGQNVIGVSKSFKPSFKVKEQKKSQRRDVGVITASLEVGERTTVFRPNKKRGNLGMWYIRIRPRDYVGNSLQGVLKLECFPAEEHEEENGFSANRVDNISTFVFQERNVTPHGKDMRWASHLYPVYMAETYIKNSFLSDTHFTAYF